jgi:hypothetical protein
VNLKGPIVVETLGRQHSAVRSKRVIACDPQRVGLSDPSTLRAALTGAIRNSGTRGSQGQLHVQWEADERQLRS